MTDILVTGTDTNVGKTVLSALLVAALDAVYWKPIQTGAAEGADRITVMKLAEIPESQTAAGMLPLRSAGFAAPGRAAGRGEDRPRAHSLARTELRQAAGR